MKYITLSIILFMLNIRVPFASQVDETVQVECNGPWKGKIISPQDISNILESHFLYLINNSSKRFKSNSAKHNQWVETLYKLQLPQPQKDLPAKQANLCGAKLHGANLRNADLRGVNLQQSDLRGATLRGADLRYADLRGSDLWLTILSNAYLRGADLRGSNFYQTDLQKTVLIDVNLQETQLNYANLKQARFNNANLQQASLIGAHLQKANFSGANLTNADLGGANLTNADLSRANLTNAHLRETNLAFANLHGTYLTNSNLLAADLTDSNYEPAISGVPDIELIMGNATLFKANFSNPGGFIALRELYYKNGIQEEARKITRFLKHNINEKKANSISITDKIDWIFNFVFFEWPTDWGVEPGRALRILLFCIIVFMFFYLVALQGPDEDAGIWKIRLKERLRDNDKEDIELIRPENFLSAVLTAFYFSILSAFHFGWKDLNVGSWLHRVQYKEYTFRATGWVRSVAGMQSLIGVYLLAIWALTYFSRPFD